LRNAIERRKEQQGRITTRRGRELQKRKKQAECGKRAKYGHVKVWPVGMLPACEGYARRPNTLPERTGRLKARIAKEQSSSSILRKKIEWVDLRLLSRRLHPLARTPKRQQVEEDGIRRRRWGRNRTGEEKVSCGMVRGCVARPLSCRWSGRSKLSLAGSGLAFAGSDVVMSSRRKHSSRCRASPSTCPASAVSHPPFAYPFLPLRSPVLLLSSTQTYPSIENFVRCRRRRRGLARGRKLVRRVLRRC
jgi:hypothetical protein